MIVVSDPRPNGRPEDSAVLPRRGREALALELEAGLVLLDDKAARRLATAIGLPVAGTPGILLGAKRAGLVPPVQRLVDALRPLPFHIAASLYEIVPRKAGAG